MRFVLLLCALLPAVTAVAADRLELTVGSVDGGDWQARGLAVDWQLGAAASVKVGALHSGILAEPASVELRCSELRNVAGVECRGGELSAASASAGRVRAQLDLRASNTAHWHLDLRALDAQVDYNSEDGRLASEALRLRLSGRAERSGAPLTVSARLSAPAGQAYAEPLFVDFGAHPATLDFDLRWRPGQALELRRVVFDQTDVGRIEAQGRIDPAAPLARHALELELHSADIHAAVAQYLLPLLAGTPLDGVEAVGGVHARALLRDGAAEALRAEIAGAALAVPAYALELSGLDGTLAWQAQAGAPESSLSWKGGAFGRVPIGAAALRARAQGADFELLQALRVPVLDGAVAVERLVLTEIGSPRMGADFAAAIEPIELAALCRALGWPEFSGTLSGRLPGLRLHEQRVDVDGTLSASAFDGEISISGLRVIDPFGVLPRVAADLRLRRIDLAAITGVFDFGRIEGRLDGDFEGLRLIGWEPVAMNARLYSTPGDRTRKRISQRAIDSISSIGGGPTGLLSRGVMRFFDDFAYARIGWSCLLENGVCRMDGVKPVEGGRGYVLVQGRGLPRIDVVGYSRQVSWPVFMAQLRGAIASGPAELR